MSQKFEDVNESIHEQRSIYREIDNDVEFIDQVQAQILSMKISKNNRHILLIHQYGYQLFDNDVNPQESLVIKEDIGIGELVDGEFMAGDEPVFLLLALKSRIVIWDDQKQRIIQEFSLEVQEQQMPINQLTFQSPYIIAAFNDTILGLNTSTKQAFRYLKDIQRLNSAERFACNNNEFNFCFAYQQAQNLILDNPVKRGWIVLSLTKTTPLTEAETFQFMKSQLQISQKSNYKSEGRNNWGVSERFVGINSEATRCAVSYQSMQSMQSIQTQLIYIYKLNWGQNQLNQQSSNVAQKDPTTYAQLLFKYSRGSSVKSLRLVFGPENTLACLSFDSHILQGKSDATVHLFFEQANQQQPATSKRRYYLATGAIQQQNTNRLRDVSFRFIGQDKFRILTSYGYMIEQKYDNPPITQMETINDYKYWLRVKTIRP